MHCASTLFCGERGIRTPGGVTLNGFQDRRIRPLCHLSVLRRQKYNFFRNTQPKYFSIVETHGRASLHKGNSTFLGDKTCFRDVVNIRQIETFSDIFLS